MDRETLLKEFTEAVNEMKREKLAGTFCWYLNTDEDGNDWAIVLGWADGFSEYPMDDNTDGTFRLCVKLAYQPNISLMQCNYELDWTMPHDEKTGEVDNAEFPIYKNTDFEEVIDYLLKCYKRYFTGEDEQ